MPKEFQTLPRAIVPESREAALVLRYYVHAAGAEGMRVTHSALCL